MTTANQTGNTKAAWEIDWRNPPSDQFVAFVEEQYEAGKRRRLAWEARTAKQLAWVQGDQRAQYDDTGTYTRLEDEELCGPVPMQHRRPIEVNRLRGLVVQSVAMLLGSGVTMMAKPRTTEDDDISAARIQTDLLKYLLYRGPDSIDHRLTWVLFHLKCAGVVYVMPEWDLDAGDPTTFSPDADGDDDTTREKAESFRTHTAERLGRTPQALKTGPNGEITVPAGDVNWRFPTGFDVTEPAGCKNIRTADWVIVSTWRAMEWMRHKYGDDKLKGIKPGNDNDEYAQDLSLQYGEYAADAQTGEQSTVDEIANREMVLVHEMWRPRRPWLMDGFYGVVCQSTELHKGPHPYVHKRIPLIPLQDMPSASVRPPATIGMAMSAQAALNRNLSVWQASVELTQIPKWLSADKGFNDDDFDRFMRVLTVTDPDKIKPLTMPPTPRDVRELHELYQMAMQDVAGVHDSSLGKAESAQQSGRHAAAMRQMDQVGNSVTRRLIETALSEAAIQSLALFHQYVDEERTVQIGGANSENRVMTFKGDSLLRKDPERGVQEFDVDVVIMPNVDNVIDRVSELTQLGYLSPEKPEDVLQVKRWLGDALPAHAADRETEARELAAIENRRLLEETKDFAVNYGDHNAVHIEEHMRFTTTAAYRAAAKKKPAIEERFRKHIYAHLTNAAEFEVRTQQAAKQMQAAASATTGEQQLEPEQIIEQISTWPADAQAALAQSIAQTMGGQSGEQGPPVGAGAPPGMVNGTPPPATGSGTAAPVLTPRGVG